MTQSYSGDTASEIRVEIGKKKKKGGKRKGLGPSFAQEGEPTFPKLWIFDAEQQERIPHHKQQVCVLCGFRSAQEFECLKTRVCTS